MQRVLHQAVPNHKERLIRLSDTLSEARVYTETEKTTRLKAIEKTILFIEDNIFDCQEAFTKTLKNLEDNIFKLQQDVDEDKKEADVIISSDMQDLMKFEQKLKSTYETICQRRKENETGLMNYLEEQTSGLSIDINNERITREENVQQLTEVYQSDIKKLRNNLNEETEERQAESEKLNTYLQNNLRDLNEDINSLQKYSENSEKVIFGNIKNSVVEVKTVLDNEKNTREATHEHMIKLLEDSYRKFRSHE